MMHLYLNALENVSHKVSKKLFGDTVRTTDIIIPCHERAFYFSREAQNSFELGATVLKV